jgi:hypothetical protein
MTRRLVEASVCAPHPWPRLCLWATLDLREGKKQSRNGLRDNGSCGEVNRPASGSGGAHQQLPVRETPVYLWDTLDCGKEKAREGC